MKLLLHACCAPCSVYCIDELKKENIIPDVYWYNPNIHPYKEYELRRDCLKEYANKLGLKCIIKDEYGNLLNQCSECLEVWDDDLNDFHASDLDFCPFCGAKMDEKVTPCDTCAKNGKCQLQSFDVVKNGEMAYCNCKEEK